MFTRRSTSALPVIATLLMVLSGLFSAVSQAESVSGRGSPSFPYLPQAEYGEGACSRPLIMAHSGDYAPYQYRGEQGELIGLDVELARLFLQGMGCQLKVVLLPPKRAQKMLAEGRIDMMAAASVTKARRKFAHFSLPYRAETSVMFIRRDNAPFMSSMSLFEMVRSGMSFTTGLGGWYGEAWEDIKPYLDEGQLSLTNSTLGQVNMVLMNRADVAVVDRYVGFYHAKTLGHPDAILEHPQVLSDAPAHFMFSQVAVSKVLLVRFNDTIGKLKPGSEYRQILQKYLPE